MKSATLRTDSTLETLMNESVTFDYRTAVLLNQRYWSSNDD